MITISKNTPRTQLVTDVLRIKGQEIEEGLVEVLGLDRPYIRLALNQFAKLSARAVVENGALDFELARGNDTPEQILQKFMDYMDSEKYDKIEAALFEIDGADKPHDEATAPELPEDAGKK